MHPAPNVENAEGIRGDPRQKLDKGTPRITRPVLHPAADRQMRNCRVLFLFLPTLSVEPGPTHIDFCYSVIYNLINLQFSRLISRVLFSVPYFILPTLDFPGIRPRVISAPYFRAPYCPRLIFASGL